MESEGKVARAEWTRRTYYSKRKKEAAFSTHSSYDKGFDLTFASDP
jgi:hypothetical protein